MKKIVIFGPGPKFKGGIALFTASLSKTLASFDNTEVHLVSWTNQYPSIIPRDFIDKSSRSDLLNNDKIKLHYITNYNNPLSWLSTINLIEKISPDILIIQWAVAVQGLPIGFIAGGIKKRINCEIIFDLHVVEQKEGTALDNYLIRFALSKADTFIVHSKRTIEELRKVFPKNKFYISETGERGTDNSITVLSLYHPIYDIYSSENIVDKEKVKNELNLKEHVFLFFGFIRKYKGLHFIIPAFAKLAKERDDVSLLIVGESFWNTLNAEKLSTKIKHNVFRLVKRILSKKKETEENYNPLSMINEFGITDSCIVINNYVPNEEVYKYFEIADVNFLYYTIATPSGVESIAYNFGVPSIAVKAGHFLDTITDEENGYFAEPGSTDSLYDAMKRSIENPISKHKIMEDSSKYSWNNYAAQILKNNL